MEERKIITAVDAIKLIINGKKIENLTIAERLVLGNQVRGKGIRIIGVKILGYLLVETSVSDFIIRDCHILGGAINLKFAEITGNIDLSGTNFDILYAEGAIALAAHMSLQSNIVSSPSKFLFFH